MARTLLLLTEPYEAERLLGAVRRVDLSAPVRVVCDRGELDAAVRVLDGDARLVGFCTPVVVPAVILDQLSGGAYNVHPGPPELPGLYPSVWAIYHGASSFGVTTHEMAPKVDSGAIVALDRFDLPPGTHRIQLDFAAHELAHRQFTALLPALLGQAPLKPIDAAWSGRTWRRRDFDALLRISPDITAEEFDRRYRAVGEGPEHALTVHLHGRDFRLAPLPDDDGAVYRGGQPVDEAGKGEK